MRLSLSIVLAVLVIGGGLWPASSQEKPAPEKKAEPDKPRLDQCGDLLPPGALARLGTVRFRHGRLSRMAMSPDGKVAVTVGGSGLHFWEVPSGKMIHHVERDGPWSVGSRPVAFSPDGKMVATMGGGVLRIWDRATAERIAWGSGQNGGACMFDTYCLGFSPDSKMIAAAGMGLPDPVPGKPGPAYCSDLRLWKIGGAKLEQLWEAIPDVADLAKPGPLAPIIYSLAFSPDGKHMASAGVAHQNNFIRIWDVATGKELRQLSAAGREVGAVAYSPDGTTLASGSDDGTLTLWDPATGQKQRQMKAPGGARSLAFSPDGARLAGGGGPQDWWYKQPNNEPFLIVWDARTGKESYRLPTDRDSVVSLAYTQDGRTLAAGLGGAVRLWDATSGKEIAHPLAGHQNSMLAVDVSPDGTTVATAGQDGVIILWDLATGQENQRLRGHRGEVRSIKYAPGGKALISAGADQTFRVWDVTSGKEIRLLDGNLKGRISSTATSADGRLVAAGDGDSGDVLVWDLRSGGQKFVFTLDIEETTLKCLAFSPDGKLLAAGTTDGPIFVWDMTTGKELHKLGSSVTVTFLAFSPDGQMFVSAGSGPVTLWDALTGAIIRRLGDGKVESKSKVVAFSPDGRTVAVEHGTSWDGKGRIRLFERLTNEVRREFIGHPAAIHSLVFSPDNKSLISASMDCTALVWDLTGQPRGTATAPLTDDQLHSLWKTLASDDAAAAGEAIWSFTADASRAVPFIEKVFGELPKMDDAPALIADLDSDQFTVREKAQRELEILGKMAEPALRRALAGGASPEVRRRVERLLEKLRGPVRNGDILQRCRAIEILEQIGTSTPGPDAPRLAALDLLKKLAGGAPEARFTQEAKASLERLAKRHAKP